MSKEKHPHVKTDEPAADADQRKHNNNDTSEVEIPLGKKVKVRISHATFSGKPRWHVRYGDVRVEPDKDRMSAEIIADKTPTAAVVIVQGMSGGRIRQHKIKVRVPEQRVNEHMEVSLGEPVAAGHK